MESAKRAIFSFGPFIAIALLFALALTALEVSYPHPSQAAALQLQSLAPVLGLGLVGTWLLYIAGVPRVRETSWRSVLSPVVFGVGFGILAVIIDATLGVSSTIARTLGVERIHVEAPYSILTYTVGAIAIESIFRLFPLGLASFVFSKLLFKGKHLAIVFCVGAILFGMLEPFSQAAILSSNPVAMAVIAIFVFGYGLVASWQLWRYGVIAPIAMRLAFYGVWHVLLGPALAGAA